MRRWWENFKRNWQAEKVLRVYESGVYTITYDYPDGICGLVESGEIFHGSVIDLGAGVDRIIFISGKETPENRTNSNKERK